MNKKVLVAYATKHGSTAEIAAAIGSSLSEQRIQVDILPVEDVQNLASYDAFVIGSAVYVGKWRKEIVRFLRENEQLLADRPVWLFSSGPSGEGDPVELLKGWRYPPAQEPLIKRLQPRDIAVFHGNLDTSTLNFAEKWAIKKVEAPVGDFRDWEAIGGWGAAIAKALHALNIGTGV